MVRVDRDTLQGDECFDPFGSPGAVGIGREVGERAKGKPSPLPCLAADFVMITINGQRQRQNRVAFVEGENLRTLIPAKLRCDEREKR